MLPIHPNPKSGELLSSWMVRLALDNGYCAHTFYKVLLGYKSEIWTRDIDCSVTNELIDLLSQNTDQSPDEIKSLSYRPLEGVLFRSLNIHAKHTWIQPLGVRHRLHTYPGLHFCPKCLGEGVSYYRLNWRLSFYTFCPKHNCILLNNCPCCSNPISFHRIAIGDKRKVPKNRDIGSCAFCEYKLYEADISKIDWRKHRYAKVYKEWLMKYEKDSSQDALFYPAETPLDFYVGIRVIASWLANTRAKRAKKGIIDEISVHTPKRPLGTTWEIERFDVNERFNLFMATFWLVFDWPVRFKSFINKYQLGKSSFEDYKGKMPEWVNKVAPH
jgi:hypothetical protein